MILFCSRCAVRGLKKVWFLSFPAPNGYTSSRCGHYVRIVTVPLCRIDFYLWNTNDSKFFGNNLGPNVVAFICSDDLRNTRTSFVTANR